ncbi:MAG: ADP-ribose pyrophosphatase [Myxococcota bacterium]|jgi:ADP-ribose pyrophosphatase
MPVLFEHAILSVEDFEVPTRDGPRRYIRVRVPDWCNVVAITRAGEVVLVRQHRWGIDAPTLEIPGGVVDPGEAPLAAAKRELREETGYGGGTWSSLGVVTSNPVIQDNRTWAWLASGVARLGEPQLGPGEHDLTVETVPVDALRTLLDTGAIHHALAVVSLQRYLLGAARSTLRA